MSYVEPKPELRTPTGRMLFLKESTNRVLGLLTSLLVVMYAAVFVVKPDQLYADDSYFYFQVAWNFSRGLGSTFNTVMPTNGYHPLWMLVCAAVFKVFPERMVATHAIAGLIVLLDVGMLLTVRRILLRVGGDMWPFALALLVPFCFLSQLGTEGALSGLMLALMMLGALRLTLAPDRGRAWMFGLAAALAVLSRLDDIFIVAFVWLAVALELPARARKLQIETIPLYAVLWGAYLASNRIYFHTWQPISGMLKSRSRINHSFGSNLPHTGMVALGVILVCGAALILLKKRDLFFRTVEAPFAAGVICHCLYIVFRMTNETRWSWYYTSWMLLAGLMLGRTASALLERRRQFALPLCSVCVLLLGVLWVRQSWFNTFRAKDDMTPASFNEVVYKQSGIHRALAFDQPGRLAYHSDIQIIPLDGLMGDLKFQHDLAAMGIERYIQVNHVDGLIGPPVPFGRVEYDEMCSQLYLASSKFHCAPSASDPRRYDTSGVDIYSRVPAALAGTIPLNDGEVVWTSPGYVSVWKLRQ